MTNSQILHKLYKEATTKSLELTLQKIAETSLTLPGIKVDRIVEAMNQGAVQVDDQDPMNRFGDEVLVRYPDNTYYFIQLGNYEITDEGNFYSLDSVEDLEDEVIADYVARCEEE